MPSAPGKRFSNDTKVTDMLYGCYALADEDKDFSKELAAIKVRYQEIIDGLHLELSLEEEFKTIEKNFKAKAGSDYAASRGEYLNGIIMADYLGYEFIDSAEVIFFKETENLMRTLQTKCFPQDWRNVPMRSFPDFTALTQTAG